MHGRGSNEGQCLLLDTLTSRATGPDLESHYSRHPMSHLIHIADQKNAAGRGCLMSNLGWKGRQRFVYQKKQQLIHIWLETKCNLKILFLFDNISEAIEAEK